LQSPVLCDVAEFEDLEFSPIEDMKRFCAEILQQISRDSTFLHSLLFPDKAKFHLDGIVNRTICKTWSSQPPQEINEHQRDMQMIARVIEVTL
jgi:hypothetical protein